MTSHAAFRSLLARLLPVFQHLPQFLGSRPLLPKTPSTFQRGPLNCVRSEAAGPRCWWWRSPQPKGRPCRSGRLFREEGVQPHELVAPCPNTHTPLLMTHSTSQILARLCVRSAHQWMSYIQTHLDQAIRERGHPLTPPYAKSLSDACHSALGI